MTNLPATISTLNQQIGALTEKLAPVTNDQVARALLSMNSAGLAFPKGLDSAKANEIYAFALQGVPAYGLQKATAGVIRGEYEIHRGFVPTPPELAAIARLETKTIRDDLVRLRETRATLEDSKPVEKPREEQLARIRQLHAMFKANHAATKVAERAVSNPEPEITEERKAYLDKIRALPDRYQGE